MCSCHSILECCVTFSGVKLSIRSFVLLFKLWELDKMSKLLNILLLCQQSKPMSLEKIYDFQFTYIKRFLGVPCMLHLCIWNKRTFC